MDRMQIRRFLFFFGWGAVHHLGIHVFNVFADGSSHRRKFTFLSCVWKMKNTYSVDSHVVASDVPTKEKVRQTQ
jgi:hypothetical protein